MACKISVRNLLIAFLAGAFQAFGMYHIHAQSDITEGGILGLTLLLEHWLDISPALSGAIFNATCFFLGWRLLGKGFLLCSGFSAGGFSAGYALVSLFPPLFPGIGAYPLAAAVIGALFIGIGAGVCVRCGGATCGDDALAMSLSHLTKIPIQWIYLASDLSVLLASLSYLSPKRIVWSLLTVILSGQIIGLIQKTKNNKSCEL